MTSVNLTLGNLGAVALTTGTTAAANTTSAPSVPAASGTVASGSSKATWAMADEQTVFVNLRVGAPGPSAWVPYVVKHVFADGNAVLVKEPNCVLYTGALVVGTNLRRKGEAYDDPCPGP